jgi:hypothetical protein
VQQAQLMTRDNRIVAATWFLPNGERLAASFWPTDDDGASDVWLGLSDAGEILAVSTRTAHGTTHNCTIVFREPAAVWAGMGDRGLQP